MYPSIELFHLSIPTFFVVICLDVVLCLLFISWRLDQWLSQNPLMSDEFASKIWNVTAVSLVFGFIGARLTHVFYELPALYLEDPIQILYAWNGGFTFFGGLISGLLAGWFYLKTTKEKQQGLFFDFFTPVISLGYIIGRLGCLLNGCCYGKTCQFPWALRFVDESGGYLWRHPTQIYAMITEALLLGLLVFIERKKQFSLPPRLSLITQRKGSLFLIWLMFHSIGRFALEFYRDDFRGPAYFLSFSGWMSLILFSLSALLLFRNSQSVETK